MQAFWSLFSRILENEPYSIRTSLKRRKSEKMGFLGVDWVGFRGSLSWYCKGSKTLQKIFPGL
jgi:hypothetical protein